ncbi:hypothetical protein [Deinococcus peraridilitoris]|uniref:Uncharacterized protein n=1 Tax=Deinococcus peraridilitoris (strain DSM 19664 / LMG 22246 / CIP 109416 / KR-200) TaxID=937777 RepID=L0A0Q1_DEIPD|nr:hypothetical protein [Deinococcus peraridilitoris]AFZ67468.1 hypothetical protein Deipe_1965 [Deinococcus peraridilitoris DSM 19664]
MALRKLSDQVQQLSNPQRSDAFVKMFRSAVREGRFDAAYVPERFTLPKQYARRGGDDRYSKDSKEMIFEVTPAFEHWFDSINQDLSSGRRAARVKPSLEAFESGELDFKALAEETRRKMDASYKKGQSLGKSRSKARPKKKTAAKK